MRESITVLGYLLGYLLTTVLLAVWFVARLHGGSVTIVIDKYGEQFPELLLWAVVVSVMTVGLAKLVQKQST